MGDFNLNLLDSSNHQPTEDFVKIVYAYGLRLRIDQPTRISPHSSSLIDNILTNHNASIWTGILYADISDHLPLFQITPSLFQPQSPLKSSYISSNINKESLNA